MASVRTLKQSINYVIGQIIEAVYLVEMTTTGQPTEATNAILEESFTIFDNLIKKVNEKNVADKKSHFKQINVELENAANQLVDKINAL
ncbi:hypothetical protein [Flavobacterium sp.]|uniref:hypothetical protein n=1 Tax=Flavobacterium sp. TaxID=239 RepID=UPI003D0ABB60